MKTFIVNNAKERGKNSYQIKFTRHLGERNKDNIQSNVVLMHNSLHYALIS